MKPLNALRASALLVGYRNARDQGSGVMKGMRSPVIVAIRNSNRITLWLSSIPMIPRVGGPPKYCDFL